MINKVILVGRLGKDPEISYASSGEHTQCTAHFPLATHEQIIDKATGDKRERTEWHHVELRGRNAENAGKILKKGRVVYIEGKIRSDVWVDEHNTKHFSIKIKASMFQILSKLGGKSRADEGEDSAHTDSIEEGTQSQLNKDNDDFFSFP